jgi:hypothetical protein
MTRNERRKERQQGALDRFTVRAQKQNESDADYEAYKKRKSVEKAKLESILNSRIKNEAA